MERAEEERAARERARDPNATSGGTWWSSPVRGQGKTFEIRSEEDWISLCREFPLEVTASRQ